jgi:hypothetical protein
MLCILYVTLVGFCLGLGALAVDRALPVTATRRWLWLGIMPVSVFLPGYYRFHHAWSITDTFGPHAQHSALTQALSSTSLGIFDPSWWTQVQSYDSLINRFWIAASGVLIIWALINAMRVSAAVSLSPDGDDEPRSIDGVPVVVTEAMGPATVGFWRSRVLIPRWVLALPGTQRQYVVRHEEEHRRAHDAQLLFLASLPLILMPWNAAIWWQLRRLCLAVELDCDNRVVAALGDAPAYGSLLLKVAEASSRGPRLQPALLGVGSLERRLTQLLAPTPLRHVQRFLLPAFAVGLLFVVLTMPHPVLHSGSHPPTPASSQTTGLR